MRLLWKSGQVYSTDRTFSFALSRISQQRETKGNDFADAHIIEKAMSHFTVYFMEHGNMGMGHGKLRNYWLVFKLQNMQVGTFRDLQKSLKDIEILLKMGGWYFWVDLLLFPCQFVYSSEHFCSFIV